MMETQIVMTMNKSNIVKIKNGNNKILDNNRISIKNAAIRVVISAFWN